MSVSRDGGDPSSNASGQTTDSSGADVSTTSAPSEGRGSDWIREAFAGRVGLRATPNGDFANEGTRESEGQPAQVAEEPKTASEPASQEPAPFRVFQSQEDFNRALQSEVDRREAQRLRRQKQQEEESLLLERPHEYADQKRRELEDAKTRAEYENSPEFVQRISSFATEQIALYDEGVLTPLTSMVKDGPEKQRLLSNVGPGIEGRSVLGKGMMDLLVKQVRAEAREAFASDPAFVKEILIRHGGQRAEPEVVSAVGAAPPREDANSDVAMNGLIRGRGRRF